MNARTLVAARCRAWTRRGTGGGALSGFIALVLAGSAVLASVWLARDWAIEAASDVPRVRGHLFWLAVLETFVFAYTTFEVSFRAEDRRFIGLLPITGTARWIDLSARNLLVHLPLLAPALGYAWGLRAAGAEELATYALALIVGTYALGIPLSGWLHLKAGLSLLAPPGAGRKMLAGATVPAEAALLLYTPALGLAGTLVGVLVMDGALRGALLRSDGSMIPTALGVLGASTALGLFLVFRASQEASGTLHRVAARFAEVDVPGPYREDGLPERCPGMGWRRVMPAGSGPFFERDLKQLKRRYRLDRILIWLTGLWALRIGWLTTDLPEAQHDLLVLGGFATLLACHGPVSTEGRQLGSRWLRNALPNPLAPRALGSWMAFFTSALWVWVWVSVAMGVAGGAEAGLWMAGVGLAASLGIWATAFVIGRLASPDRLGAYGLVWSTLGLITISVCAGRFG